MEQKTNKDPQYFTAILQLRFLTDEIVSFLRNTVRKDKEKTFISKEVKQPNGIDFYLSSNKFARRVAKQMIDRFGGKLSEAERLFSYNKQESKNIYRMNILIEFPEYAKNEIIKFKEKLYKVRNIGKNVNLLEVSSGKSIILEYKNIKEIEKAKKFETRVVKIYPKLEVLDEDNNSVVVSNKPEKELKIGEKVKVVFDDGCYLV